MKFLLSVEAEGGRTLVREVDWPSIPRRGDEIEFALGWSSTHVDRVLFLHDGTLKVILDVDLELSAADAAILLDRRPSAEHWRLESGPAL